MATFATEVNRACSKIPAAQRTNVINAFNTFFAALQTEWTGRGTSQQAQGQLETMIVDVCRQNGNEMRSKDGA